MKNGEVKIVPASAFRADLSEHLDAAQEGVSVVVSRAKGPGRASATAALVPVRVVEAGLHRLGDVELTSLRAILKALGPDDGIVAGSVLAREGARILAKTKMAQASRRKNR